MASPAATRIATAPDEQARIPPDEVLEIIFLRLDSGADLARASATCRAFRRVATGHSFLRSFASLHPPPVFGFFHIEATRGLQPAEPPCGTAPAARALAQAGDFTFSFLPSSSHPDNGWRVCDVRDGRFLLSRDAADGSTFRELVVCDPLHRRYVQIPPIPNEIVPRTPSCCEMKSEPFFAPSDEGGLEKVSQFRVIYNWLSNYKIMSFTFSSATGKWCYATSFRFLPARLILQVTRLKRYYARSSFYWVHKLEKYMLMLDPCEMKFSLVQHHVDSCHDRGRSHGLAIVDAAEDRLGLITLEGRMLDLYTKTCQNSGVGADECRHDRRIPLPEIDHNYFIIGATKDYLIVGALLHVATHGTKIQYSVLNLTTLLVERMCVLNDTYENAFHGIPCVIYPPPLSPPSL